MHAIIKQHDQIRHEAGRLRDEVNSLDTKMLFHEVHCELHPLVATRNAGVDFTLDIKFIHLFLESLAEAWMVDADSLTGECSPESRLKQPGATRTRLAELPQGFQATNYGVLARHRCRNRILHHRPTAKPTARRHVPVSDAITPTIEKSSRPTTRMQRQPGSLCTSSGKLSWEQTMESSSGVRVIETTLPVAQFGNFALASRRQTANVPGKTSRVRNLIGFMVFALPVVRAKTPTTQKLPATAVAKGE